MSLKNIDQFSFGYQLLFAVTKVFHCIFYKKITIRNRELIPENTPVIFLANHQNALMDALAILFGVNKPIVFMARADMFKKPAIASLLYFLKIMPIFRPRDGADNMGQNDAIFRRSVDVLRNRRAMAMFPEGAFNPYKNLQPLKKGFARMAFMSEASADFTLNLHVVPVGIDYSDKKNRNAELMVQFGKPIPLLPLKEIYKENPTQAYKLLSEQVREALLPLMINIEATEYYDTYMQYFDFHVPIDLSMEEKPDTHYNRFVLQQQYAEALNKLAVEDPESMTKLQKELSDFPCWPKPLSLLRLLRSVLSLLWSICKLPFYPPLLAPQWVLPKIKDKQFVASIKFAVWMFASFVYYPLLILIIVLLW